MRFQQYLNQEIDESFTSIEDPSVAKEFDYSQLTLKKAPKQLSYIIKMLKKHLDSPLNSLTYKNGTRGDGGMNLAVYSESQNGMSINLTNIKKLKTGQKPKTNFHDELKANKESLEKWLAFQEKAKQPNDVKKARGAVNTLKVRIRNLEDKINKGETPVPFSSASYASNEKDAIEAVILHELGHKNKHKADLFKLQVFFNKGEFPTEYSKRNISEYHSEIYSLVKMGLINKSPISDEAKKYFRKALK